MKLKEKLNDVARERNIIILDISGNESSLYVTIKGNDIKGEHRVRFSDHAPIAVRSQMKTIGFINDSPDLESDEFYEMYKKNLNNAGVSYEFDESFGFDIDGLNNIETIAIQFDTAIDYIKSNYESDSAIWGYDVESDEGDDDIIEPYELIDFLEERMSESRYPAGYNEEEFKISINDIIRWEQERDEAGISDETLYRRIQHLADEVGYMKYGGQVSDSHKPLGTANDLELSLVITEHDMVAECAECNDKFSYEGKRDYILWECPYCECLKHISNRALAEN